MSKHNYSQYSKKKNDGKSGAVGANAPKNTNNINDTKPKIEDPVIKPAPVKMELKNENPVTMEQSTVAPVASVEPAIEMVQETVDTVTLPETVVGTVINCAKLNVRATPSINAEIVYVLDVMSEIQIDVVKSDNEWLKVCTATGVEGYCMRKFVDAYL